MVGKLVSDLALFQALRCKHQSLSFFAAIPARNSSRPNIHWTAQLSGLSFAPQAVVFGRWEVHMLRWFSVRFIRQIHLVARSQWVRPTAILLTLLIAISASALAQGSPFDTGFTAIQSLFTGTIAKVASLVAIVIGGYGFAHGEPGAKKALAGVAAGTGIAVLAVNVLSWLWGV
jgi:type IV secretory pathway VirB2 component (pilin)